MNYVAKSNKAFPEIDSWQLFGPLTCFIDDHVMRAYCGIPKNRVIPRLKIRGTIIYLMENELDVIALFLGSSRERISNLFWARI